jgi:hypothetical protein
MGKSAEARAENSGGEHHRRSEIDRANARIRHFRGVAAGVLVDAEKVWGEICRACQNPRTCEEILEGAEGPAERAPSCGWPEFLEKLHLLGHYVHYTRRLCDGSLDETTSDEREV